MMIKFLIIKEFKQFFRNPFLPKLIVIFPIMIMLVIPWIMTMDIKNIRLAVVDTDGSSMSGKFIQKIDASGYFILRDVSANYNESMEQLMLNKVDAIIVHELCHMKYKYHNNDFYNLVSKYINNYKEIDLWLKKNSEIIMF